MKKLFLVVVSIAAFGLTSCEPKSTTEIDELYEIEAIDKEDVRSPDDREQD